MRRRHADWHRANHGEWVGSFVAQALTPVKDSPMPTILIAEDEQSVATLLRDILEDEGYAVLLAYNGQEALEMLKTSRPALVMTDVMMPLVDGVTLCRTIQAD